MRDRVVDGVTFRGIHDADEWLSFAGVRFVDCTFEDCNLQWHFGADHERQERASHLIGCRILGCDLRNLSLAYGRIEGCTFEACQWGRHLGTLDLVDNAFLGVVEALTLWGRDLPLADLIPRPRPNEIRGNDFRRADLRGLGLWAEVPVRDQLWPEGPNCAIVDRVPERIAAIVERTAASDDPRDQELHVSATWWDVMHPPGTEQSALWLRWDDPAMPDESNRLHRAIGRTEPARPTA